MYKEWGCGWHQNLYFANKVTHDFVVIITRPVNAWDGWYPVLSTAFGCQERWNRTLVPPSTFQTILKSVKSGTKPTNNNQSTMSHDHKAFYSAQKNWKTFEKEQFNSIQKLYFRLTRVHSHNHCHSLSSELPSVITFSNCCSPTLFRLRITRSSTCIRWLIKELPTTKPVLQVFKCLDKSSINTLSHLM